MAQNEFRHLADTVALAKTYAGAALGEFPMEIEGYSDLEYAIQLLGKVESNLDEAADDPDNHL